MFNCRRDFIEINEFVRPSTGKEFNALSGLFDMFVIDDNGFFIDIILGTIMHLKMRFLTIMDQLTLGRISFKEIAKRFITDIIRDLIEIRLNIRRKAVRRGRIKKERSKNFEVRRMTQRKEMNTIVVESMSDLKGLFEFLT